MNTILQRSSTPNKSSSSTIFFVAQAVLFPINSCFPQIFSEFFSVIKGFKIDFVADSLVISNINSTSYTCQLKEFCCKYLLKKLRQFKIYNLAGLNLSIFLVNNNHPFLGGVFVL
jgi:hypothetical protein